MKCMNRHKARSLAVKMGEMLVLELRKHKEDNQVNEARIDKLECQVEYLISQLPFWKRDKARREILEMDEQEVICNDKVHMERNYLTSDTAD